MSSKRARTTGASSSRQTASRTNRSGRGNSTNQLPHIINEYDIDFASDYQRTRYDKIASREFSSPRYIDCACLRNLGLWNDVRQLMATQGWLDFIRLRYRAYKKITLEIMSSMQANTIRGCRGNEGSVSFRVFDTTYNLTLAQFNELFKLPPGGSRAPENTFLVTSDIWNRITYDAPPFSSSCKSAHICNPCFRYIQCFMAHTIFARGDSTGVPRLTELYFLWAMTENFKLDTGAFIAKQIESQGNNSAGKIALGGICTAIAYGLGLDQEIEDLENAIEPCTIDLEHCCNINLITRINESYWLRYHGAALFPLPNPTRTTVSNRANWRYSIRNPPFEEHQRPVRVLSQEGEGSRDEDRGEGTSVPDVDAGPSTSRGPPFYSAYDMQALQSSLATMNVRIGSIEAEQHRQGSTMESMNARLGTMDSNMASMQQMLQTMYDWHINQGYPPPNN